MYARLIPYLFYFLLAVETHELLTDFGQQWAHRAMIGTIMYLVILSSMQRNLVFPSANIEKKRPFWVSIHVAQGYVWSFFTYYVARMVYVVLYHFWHFVIGSLFHVFFACFEYAHQNLAESIPLFGLLIGIYMMVMPAFLQISILSIVGMLSTQLGILIPRIAQFTLQGSTKVYSMFSLIGPLDLCNVPHARRAVGGNDVGGNRVQQRNQLEQ